jgi:ABC-type phosphate transport system substrate-binding protein
MRARLLFLLLLSALALPTRADVVVVVHPHSPLKQLTAVEVSDLYLGRIRSIRDGQRLTVLDQSRDSPLRARFFGLLNGMDLHRLNAYWARLQFSGDTQPPASLPDSQTVIELVRRDPLAIGYIDAAALTGAVRPVLTLKE